MNRRPGPAAPTTKDVAAAAGVSPATAARALGQYGSVSAETRERVQAAAERLGYRANSLARSMRAGTTDTIALVVADIENSFFARLTRGFTDAARASGFEVLVANTDEDIDAERSAVKVMLEKRIDGLVVAPASRIAYDHLEAAKGEGVEIVLIDRHIPRLGVDSVLVDSRKAAEVGIGHVIERGHRRIALVTGASPGDYQRGHVSRHLMSTGRERIDGYRRALTRAGIEVDPAYLKLGDFHRDAAGRMALELLELPQPPTAIFCTDSMITLGTLEALQGAGVAIPNEVSILGFDDPEWSQVVSPRLTVVTQPVYDLGAVAAERVIARIRGDHSAPRRHNLPTELVVRESVSLRSN